MTGQVWSQWHNSQITDGTGQLRPDTPTFPQAIWLAIASAFDEEKARNDAQLSGSSSLLGSVGSESSSACGLDPLFAGCLPSNIDETTGIDWRKADGTKDHPVWASVSIETEPPREWLPVPLSELVI